VCIPFIWTTHQVTYGSTSKFHLRAFAPSYLFQHVFQQDIWSPLCSILFWPKGKCLVYSLTSFPNLSNFLSFFHNVLNVTWTTPSLNCRYFSMRVHTSHQPYGYPPFYVAFITISTWEPMMQFVTPLLLWYGKLASMWDENNYICFLRPHSTSLVNESTLCWPKMAFVL
jgi:hypothetical protein